MGTIIYVRGPQILHTLKIIDSTQPHEKSRCNWCFPKQGDELTDYHQEETQEWKSPISGVSLKGTLHTVSQHKYLLIVTKTDLLWHILTKYAGRYQDKSYNGPQVGEEHPGTSFEWRSDPCTIWSRSYSSSPGSILRPKALWM